MDNDFCCTEMDYFTHSHCDVHNNVFDCPDCLIYYDKKDKQYGIIVHDGGTSFINISFCPWCGVRLKTKL